MPGPPTVLVLDDDRDYARVVIAGRLAPFRFRMLFAASNCEAAALLARLDQLDGATLDLKLPDGDGIATGEEIRRRFGGIPLVVVTDFIEEPGNVARASRIFAEPISKRNLAPLEKFGLDVAAGRRMYHPDLVRRVEALSITRDKKHVLLLHLAGAPRPEIAERLRVAKKTVDSHLEQIVAELAYETLAALEIDLLGYPLHPRATKLGGGRTP